MAALWYAQERYSNESLLERYSIAPNLELIRSSVSNVDLLAAVDAYEAGAYVVVDSLLLDLLPDDPDFVFGEYLLGHSYLNHNRISNAILSFESVYDFGVSPVQDDAVWMTIIAMIRRGRMEEAESKLTELADSQENKYALKATYLQGDLHSWWRQLIFLR